MSLVRLSEKERNRQAQDGGSVAGPRAPRQEPGVGRATGNGVADLGARERAGPDPAPDEAKQAQVATDARAFRGEGGRLESPTEPVAPSREPRAELGTRDHLEVVRLRVIEGAECALDERPRRALAGHECLAAEPVDANLDIEGPGVQHIASDDSAHARTRTGLGIARILAGMDARIWNDDQPVARAPRRRIQRRRGAVGRLLRGRDRREGEEAEPDRRPQSRS
jgi:hypothetical protein